MSERSYPDVVDLTARALRRIGDWEAAWGEFERHAASAVDAERLDAALDDYLGRLGGNYPFFHPRYAGQMLKPPHPVAVAAYAAAMRINPNNHALDGGPPTGAMEKEVVADLAAMFGLPGDTLGHLTGGGTVANLEALWVARHLHPDRAVAFSADAHYTHGRMSEVLGLDAVAIPTDGRGHIDLDALEDELKTGRIGTVVLTPGTTGLGSVDAVHEALALRERYGVRLHADAAYGGFFTLLAAEESGSGKMNQVIPDPDRESRGSAHPVEPRFREDDDGKGEAKSLAAIPSDFPAEAYRALADCDSVVVDPHKHGLQPYGCGCVLFRDPSVGRFYRHDSPYTYFTSDELHLGEISLECSRPGAAAGALWLTLRALGLREGIGPILAACLRAARDWAARIESSDVLDLYLPPETDIVTFVPRTAERTLSAVDAASQRLFDAAMADDDPVFLSLYRVPADAFTARFPDVVADVPHSLPRTRSGVRILRSVLMKPEHERAVAWLHDRVESFATHVIHG
jgi:glutamate/tyrosine decarboxylase-like PLP-dependent enzyme